MISFALVVFTCVLFYLYLLKHIYSYWKKIGVKGPTPLPIIGNFGKVMILLESLSELARKAYKQYPKEKVVGMYCGCRKVLLLRDPNIIKHVLTKDFKLFMNRGLKTTDRGFSNNLISAEGQTWMTLRKKLTTAFTSSKLKQMTPLIQECIDRLITCTENQVKHGKTCDIKDLGENYFMDTTCSCIFGLRLDVNSNEIKQFREITKLVTQPNIAFWIWYVAEMIIPGIQFKINKIHLGSYLRSFFLNLVTSVINERESRGIKRNDLMNIMIDLKAKDQLKVDYNNSLEIRLDDNVIASQALVFSTAGKETSTSTLGFLLYELSLHKEIQDKVYKEICQVFDKFNEVNYDSIKEMNYLNMIYRETLRKYPPLGFMIRQAASDYLIPGTKFVIKANTAILISLSGIHNDAQYFKDPEKFNPENFSEENLTKIPQNVYMPFGDGPRHCIALRLAEMQILMAAATFLRKFRLSPSKKRIRYNNKYLFLTTIGGIWVDILKR